MVDHHLGGVISQSFSATEQSFPSAESLLRLRAPTSMPRPRVSPSSPPPGDSGAADVGPDGSTYYLNPVTSWPDSDPLVTGVGGTQLHLNDRAPPQLQPRAWNDTYNVATNKYIDRRTTARSRSPVAAASRSYSAVPSTRTVSESRWWANGAGVPDISMSAACNGAVDMYQSFPARRPGGT